jgi:leucyl/phenylalanyl-tRNA--protein transferase
MAIVFPPVHQAAPDGLLAIGGELNIETLNAAYKSGVFPWPIEPDYPMTWFAPNPRGVIDLDDFKISKSLQKFLKKTNFTFKFNVDFEQIIEQCRKVPRKHESGTWIHPQIITAYCELFKNEQAYCVGTYLDDKLVGGLYGVCIGEIISGESMFHLSPNASKFALYNLILKLKSKGISFIDTQMVTEVIAAFGGKNISRTEFMQRLGHLNSKIPRENLFN